MLEGPGLAPGAQTFEALTEDDMAAVRELMNRKAAVMWIGETPRTTLLHLPTP